ncbi:MAG: glycosyltransferase family 4 protein [Anaerolineales bacterium]|jgi:glycosyltransferase involved in cell wall biosynthesis
MRILVLTNFYPPLELGGYGQWCYEITQWLQSRGHCIEVLTSNYQTNRAPKDEPGVQRSLYLEGDLNYYSLTHFFTKWPEQHSENLNNLKNTIESFAPDVIFVWGMWAMSKALPAMAEKLMPSRVVYFISDYWPSFVDTHTSYWYSKARRWYMRPIKRVMRKYAQSILLKSVSPNLIFQHAIIVSQAVKDTLVNSNDKFDHATVIRGGTDISRFDDIEDRDFSKKPLELLYAGQLVEHKGVHTAIEAMAELVNDKGIDCITLTIVGSGHPDYENHLRELVKNRGLKEYVIFYGRVDKDEMPQILSQYDVLIFPSIYEEPLARMTQEAMAARLVVVGTPTGGTKEILKEGKNGLTFMAEDSSDLAEQISKLIDDPELCRQLAESGRRSVEEYFNLDRMATEIEIYLDNVYKSKTNTAPLLVSTYDIAEKGRFE